jgi:hypothetical protein
MAWWCLTCAKQLNSKRGCECANPDAQRIPPLDGFVTLTVDGYTLTEEDELAARRAWFERKRKKVVTE